MVKLRTIVSSSFNLCTKLLTKVDNAQDWHGKGGRQQPGGFLLHDVSDKMDKKSKKRWGASATKPANPTTSAYAE